MQAAQGARLSRTPAITAPRVNHRYLDQRFTVDDVDGSQTDPASSALGITTDATLGDSDEIRGHPDDAWRRAPLWGACL
jgi:hypothetical protein